jgi:uncharacterized membrane protein
MRLWQTDKSRRRGQATIAFKVMVWIVCGYIVIAALHGAAPQMWRHHVDQKDDSGPFRILLFTLFTAIAMAIFVLALQTANSVVPLPYQPFLTDTFKSPWLLRGPPLS